MAQIPKGRLVKGPYKAICRDCAIYFSITVLFLHMSEVIQIFFFCKIKTQLLSFEIIKD